ncbi:hypothetical protein ACFL6S_11105, partial [Candidatus Poribacteria bacterium]
GQGTDLVWRLNHKNESHSLSMDGLYSVFFLWYIKNIYPSYTSFIGLAYIVVRYMISGGIQRGIFSLI